MKIPDLKSIVFGVPKEQINNDSTESLVPVKNISDGIIQLNNGKYVTVLEVLPLNFYLKSESEQKNIISGFAAWLKIAPSRLQIVAQTRPADIDAFCERLEGYYNSEPNENCRRMIFEDAQLVNYIAENQAVTRRFYIVLPYEGKSEEMSVICDEMSDTVNTARQYLEACGLETVTHTNEDIFLYELLCGLLRPSLRGIKPTQIPEDIRDSLAPDSADMTHRDYTVTEGEYRSYLYLSAGGYPSSAGLAWAAPFAEAGGGITAVFYLERKSREEIIPKIGNAAVFNRS